MRDAATVASEGGPLLLGDASVLVGSWRGAFDPGGEFMMAVDVVERSRGAIASFASDASQIESPAVALVDVPAGVADVSSDGESLEIRFRPFTGRQIEGDDLELKVVSGTVIVAWSAADLRQVKLDQPELSGWMLTYELPIGRYRITADFDRLSDQAVVRIRP